LLAALVKPRSNAQLLDHLLQKPLFQVQRLAPFVLLGPDDLERSASGSNPKQPETRDQERAVKGDKARASLLAPHGQ